MVLPNHARPLILTLMLDKPAQAFYQGLRTLYFPPERNLIAAHLTLFHQLPDDELSHQALGEVARACSVFPLTHPTIRSIGRGVAVFFQSDRLAALHADLSATFAPYLIPQDRQRFQPHIVVQNKVDSKIARNTLEQLHGNPLMEPQGMGLTLWRYMDGPWEYVCHFCFGVV